MLAGGQHRAGRRQTGCHAGLTQADAAQGGGARPGHWHEQNSSVPQGLNDIQFVNARRGAAVGDANTIVRTDDGGVTWRRVFGGTQSDVELDLHDVLWVNNQEAWAKSYIVKVLLHTRDGGLTWRRVKLPLAGGTDTLEGKHNCAQSESGGNYFLLCWGLTGTRLFRTDDAGANWHEITHNLSLGGIGTAARLPFLTLQEGRCAYIRGVPSHGYLATTTDGGTTWTEQSVDFDRAARVQFLDSNTGWILPEAGTLLRTIDGGSSAAAGPGDTVSPRAFYERAFDLLESEAVRQAIDVEQEDRLTRQRYGFGPKGQSFEDGPFGNTGASLGIARSMRGLNLLLARRLVEAGVPFVNVYDFKQQGKNWDSHSNNFGQLKDELLPGTDQGLSALIEDLNARGLLDSTLVVAIGEFGRTPKINPSAGRDHWPDCYSALLAGGGVQAGAVYGSTDRFGAYPAIDPVTPADLAATIFWRFGIDPATEIHDATRRPYPLAAGQPLRRLFHA
jgi:photosystem II stability/assembly factor-like uncharacterized protein